MADVENVSTVTAVIPTAATVAVTATDQAISQVPICKPIVVDGAGVRSEVTSEGNSNLADLGTSPTQEKSSNSHPHDSEYDTASDLEGNEEYDDDEDDMDDSLTEDDDEESEDESETDNDDEDDDEGVDVDLQGQEKIDADAQKKVDEDRSNPQYIPKRGTFYEHDDRTAELEEGVCGERQEAGESPLVIAGGTGSVTGSKTSTTPTISTASKTMKKWQPASAVDRWSHDRFDPSEQAPKSRAELVNAYGYDIRTEDAPPKARRRRRYGRGPSKYNRNWEDESAYLKNNNKERKPPKPSDFPALNEKSSKPRRTRRTREEKENRIERRKRDSKPFEGRIERTDKMGTTRNNHSDDHDHRGEPRSDRSERNIDGNFKQQNRPKSYSNRGQNQASVGRQAAMEFKQKNRQSYQNSATGPSNINSSPLSSRLEAQRQPQQQQIQNMRKTTNGSEIPKESRNQLMSSQNQNQQQSQMFESYNNKKKHLDQGYQPVQSVLQNSSLVQQQIHQQQSPQTSLLNHSINRQNSQIQNKTPQQPTSNLSQRLQQVQNRNDPSHVGSVQMHALATQNQQQQQQQQQHIMQQQAANMMMGGPPQQQQQLQNQSLNQQPMEQRGPPKRYSSLRRSQHDSQHIADHQQQQQLQQIHMQQQQQQTPAPASMMMPPDQAMLQANLMQMYHQENLQAQMQALQVTQQSAVTKPNYVGQGPQASPQQPYPGANPTPTAYYVASPDAYTAAATAAVTAQATQAAATYAAQQANPNFLTQQQTAAAAAAASLVYNNPNNPPQQTVASGTTYGPPGQVGVVSQPPTGSAASGGYQNYNTVGGTTYFVPPPAQASSRPVSLPQRRPTNAIPILPPSEKSKQQKPQDSKTDESKSSTNPQSSSNQPPIGSAENIDHIIDNMFMQRPAFQPPPATTTTPTSANASSKSPTSSAETATSIADNLNIANTSSQDNTPLAPENINKSTNDTPTAVTTASSSVTNATATNTTESSNNNQISAQE